MQLYDILKLKFPNADFRNSIKLQDDGKGVYIKEWNLQDPQPTQDDIDQWQTDYAQAYQFQQNKIINQSIYDALKEIDDKSIRALRSNDTQRLTDLENQAVALRAQLLPIA